MSEPLAYLNGRFLPQSQAGLALHDAGFVFGATVTDFCRTFGRHLFRWGDHLARFRHDCAACRIPLAADDGTLTRLAEALVEHNAALIPPTDDLALITFATPGPVGYYLGQPGGADGPTFGMHTFPLPLARYRRLFSEGASLAVAGHQPVADDAVLDPRVKHRSRMLWWLAEQRLKGRADYVPGQLALLLDGPDGNLLETSFANVLVVFDGVLTSPPSADILDGIGLRVVRELAASLDVPLAERRIPVREAAELGEEALLTGTAFGVAGVSRIEGRGLPWPGPVTRRLTAKFAECAGFDVVGQILASR